MLNQIVLPVIEILEDKSLVPLIAERASTAISERGLRNEKGLSPATEEKIIRAIDKNLRDELINKGYADEEINRWIQCRPKSLYAGIIYDSQTSSIKYPLTLELAVQIDEISARVFEAHEARDMKRVYAIINNAKILTPDYWDHGSTGNLAQHKLKEPSELIIQQALKHISANCMLSILASWDVEFGAQYFKNYQPRSIFELVLPKISATEKLRGKEWHPNRRLLSLLSCLGHFIQHGKWPKSPAKVKDLAKALNVNESEIVKRRSGVKKISVRQFQSICKDLARGTKGNLAEMPTPLHIAATFWDLSLSRKILTTQELDLASGTYLKWWSHHRKKFEAIDGPTGVTSWPQCFTQI